MQAHERNHRLVHLHVTDFGLDKIQYNIEYSTELVFANINKQINK